MPVKARSIREALTPECYAVNADGCWIWQRRLSAKGYGALCAEGREVRAHRASYELAHGEIPDGFHIHHLCRNRRCINPDHLEAIDGRDHPVLHRDERPVSLHCRNGHLRSFENCFFATKASGARRIVCRVCDRESHKERKAARVAAAITCEESKTTKGTEA